MQKILVVIAYFYLPKNNHKRELIQLYPEIAFNARDLVWNQGLNSQDAVHVATSINFAKRFPHIFQTTDKELLKLKLNYFQPKYPEIFTS